MNFPRPFLLLFVALLVISRVAPALAQEAFADDQTFAFPEGLSEFALNVGYSNISVGSSLIDNDGALRIDASLMFSPLRDQLPQLRLGGGVGASMILDNSNRTIISNNGNLVFIGSSDVPFWMLEPELRVSWRQTLGEQRQFFIEPGVAGGVAFGFLDLNAADQSGDSFDANDSTVYGRVFLRAGAHVTGGTAGIEASWLSGGSLDFGADNARGDLSEWSIGVFGALLF